MDYVDQASYEEAAPMATFESAVHVIIYEYEHSETLKSSFLADNSNEKLDSVKTRLRETEHLRKSCVNRRSETQLETMPKWARSVLEM